MEQACYRTRRDQAVCATVPPDCEQLRRSPGIDRIGGVSDVDTTLDYASPRAASGTIRGMRWWICGLLFFATTINYIDRGVIGVLKPTLQHDLGWSEIDYSNIVFAFQLAYAGGYLFGGRLMDAIGLRVGYALAIAVWSLAAMGHGFARSVMGFSAAR